MRRILKILKPKLKITLNQEKERTTKKVWEILALKMTKSTRKKRKKGPRKEKERVKSMTKMRMKMKKMMDERDKHIILSN